MSTPLPWRVVAPYDRRDGRMIWSVWDGDGNAVLEAVSCDDDEAKDACVQVANAVNRTGPPVCAHCGAPAACFGSYEDDLHPAFACDTCCGHGCEDGRCELVARQPVTP